MSSRQSRARARGSGGWTFIRRHTRARDAGRETDADERRKRSCSDRTRARGARYRPLSGANGAGRDPSIRIMSDSVLEKIAAIELEMSRTQKNKATATHLGSLRAKLAKLQRELIDAAGPKGGPKGEGFDVTKTGDCRVGLVGFPSVGKSTLLTKLTGVFSEAAAYEFTTLTCVPGVVSIRRARDARARAGRDASARDD